MGDKLTSGAMERRDGQNEPTGALTWTGEVQAIAFTDTAGTTKVTVNGSDFLVTATTACHIVFGPLGIPDATATGADECFYLPANVPTKIFVPPFFRRDPGAATAEGKLVQGSLYINVVRNSADGTLYLSEYLPLAGSSRTVPLTSTTTTT
ncbi:MAG: hypothetical protein GY820_39580 [Gammaproteobacteria bacterium]|nr:hypothetical protein [Gammaproteobacteria bacterium]